MEIDSLIKQPVPFAKIIQSACKFQLNRGHRLHPARWIYKKRAVKQLRSQKIKKKRTVYLFDGDGQRLILRFFRHLFFFYSNLNRLFPGVEFALL